MYLLNGTASNSKSFSLARLNSKENQLKICITYAVCIRVYFFSKTALKQPNLAKSTFLYFKVVNYYFFTSYLTNSCRFWCMISIFARIFLIEGVASRLADWTSETQKNIEVQKFLTVAQLWPQLALRAD